ncbi:metal-dependent transcriptional regulator [Leucobacter sp. GX24907]
MDELIDPTEMYLKVVLEYEEAGIVPVRARLSERLGQAPSTVTQTVGRMVREDLFFSVPGDRQIYLSPRGRHLALSIMRKHRLAERLLADIIGLEWNLIHEEACRWEHVMSDKATELIARLLDHPTHSPYGNRIPTLREVERGFTQSLASSEIVNTMRYTFDAEPDDVTVVQCIGESAQSNPDLLKRMSETGVVPGAEVLIERSPLGVILRLAHPPERSLELDHIDASQVFVSPAQSGSSWTPEKTAP